MPSDREIARQRKKAIAGINANPLRCPECREWIPCRRGRLALDGHIQREHPAAYARQRAYVAELLGADREVERA